jgi:class 3 adenylate cyclase
VEATVDVAAWLKNLGLEQYETAFRDNAIDGDLLPSLTAEDLRDLGVSIVGHRRRLLDAIAALGAASKPTPPPAAASPPATLLAPAVSSRPEPRSGTDAERRPITVMFCDLVGSTSLAAKLDAEDWRNLVNAYLDQASAAVTGFGGHVLKRLGDGLMALFGYPQAQENDAERAVRAALAIQRGLADINARNSAKGEPELSARIGLESGPVVVEASGEVFGDAPNIAARVQAAADPGSVLITTNVHRQVAGLFVVEERGPHALKGASTPVALYRIVRASGGRRFGARTLTPLVGREEELALLRRRWERASNGAGQLTLIVGEPGIGKSRLVEEFRATLGETPHTFVELSSSQLLQNTPLHPIAEWGRQRFGADEPADRRLDASAHRPRHLRIRAPDRAAGRYPAAGRPRVETRAGGIAPSAAGGADDMVSRRGALAACRARVRRPALGRPDFARPDADPRRARRASADAHPRDRTARVSPALEPALSPQRHFAEPPGSRRRRAYGRRACGLPSDLTASN